MYFRQILHPDLGCASYLIADHGEAVVIDPKWEIDEYRMTAADAGAEIRHVLETHNHADHVSGRRRLTSATGATAHVPAGPDQPGVRDGDTVRVGDLELVAPCRSRPSTGARRLPGGRGGHASAAALG